MGSSTLRSAWGTTRSVPAFFWAWAKGPVAARKTKPGEGVGTTFTVRARIGPFTVESPYEVDAWEPPNRFGGCGTAGPVAFHEEYVLSPNAHGTLVSYRIEATPRGPFRYVEPAVRRQLRRLLAGDLDRLRALVENET